MRSKPTVRDTADARASRRTRSRGGAAGVSAPADVLPPEGWDAVLRAIPATIEPKKHLNVRLDADVWRWFKAQGRGYQTRMNAVLRAYMLVERERQRSS
jgi:uncharacterized protein (DUF4415 family)